MNIIAIAVLFWLNLSLTTTHTQHTSPEASHSVINALYDVDVVFSCNRQTDSLVLVKLYEVADGRNWTNPWDLNRPMNTWQGVFLDANGCVRILGLGSRKLDGVIPDEIGDLSALEELYLDKNALYGSIPNTIGKLSSLKKISLAFNFLTGTIPASMSDLTNLEVATLGNNPFSRSMVPAELLNLPKLTLLWIDFSLIDSLPPFSPNPNLDLNLPNNYLTFDDILNGTSQTMKNFSYFNQAKIYKDTTINARQGETIFIDLGIDKGVRNSYYVWSQNGQFYRDEYQPTFTITNIQPQDAGNYSVKISNEDAQSVNLSSYTIVINVEAVCNATFGEVAVTLCPPITTYEINGQTYTPGQYSQTLTNAAGCDSMLTLKITQSALPDGRIEGDTLICAGATTTLKAVSEINYTYKWSNGATTPEVNVGAGKHSVTVTNEAGCERIWDVVVKQDDEVPKITCPSDISLETDGTGAIAIWAAPLVTDTCPQVEVATTHNSGDLFPIGSTQVTYTATDAQGNSQQCSFKVNVAEKEAACTPDVQNFTKKLCPNGSYDFAGELLTQAGDYTKKFQNQLGCDSTVNITLQILPSYELEQTILVCTPEEVGIMPIFLTTKEGCDSIINIKKVYEPNSLTILDRENATTCDPTKVGTDTIVVKDTNGNCEGIVLKTTTLAIANSPTTRTEIVCRANLAGRDTLTFSKPDGCDSLVVVNKMYEPLNSNRTASICGGQSYNFYGRNLTSAGTYETTVTGVCDTFVRLILTLDNSIQQALEAQFCQGETFEFGTLRIQQPGVYTQRFTAKGGCDSLVTLVLEEVEGERIRLSNDTISVLSNRNNLDLNILANDVLPNEANRRIAIIESPRLGTINVMGEKLSYQLQNTGNTGVDQFRYQVCVLDCVNNCDTATVVIQMTSTCLDSLIKNIPTAFIPNSDEPMDNIFDPLAGISNECFQQPSNAEFMIVNAWGELVYRAKPYRAWDGKNNNDKPLPQGTYYYVLKFEIDNEEPELIKGWVTLFGQ